MKLRNMIFAVLITLVFLHAGVLAAMNSGQADYPEWAVTAAKTAGILLLSDSPEIVPDNGITYQDTVSGNIRLFLYHVNGTNEVKKFAILLENSNDIPAKLTVYKNGFAGPDRNYMAVGKEALDIYIKSTDYKNFDVPAHATRELTDLSKISVRPNELINGIYDFVSDQPITVKIIMLPQEQAIEPFAKEVKILPADEQQLRGTFVGRDRLIIPNQVYNPERDSAVAITLADDEVDEYLEGIDATDGSTVVNYGNYGVMYRLFIPTEGNAKIAYYINPRGGSYAGAMGVKYRHNFVGAVLIPSGRTDFGNSTKLDYGLVGTFDAGQSLWLTFSPPGASNLPVKLIIQPAKG